MHDPDDARAIEETMFRMEVVRRTGRHDEMILK